MPAHLRIPGIQGEGTGAFFGWIEVLNVQWGQRPIKEITVFKYQDSTSTALYGRALNGDPKNMTIAFASEGRTYMTIELKGVLVSGDSAGPAGGAGSDRPTESVTLNAESVSYSATKKDEAATGYDSSTEDYTYQVCYPDYGFSSLEE
jgi:type VI protein secretion system component Hcp